MEDLLYWIPFAPLCCRVASLYLQYTQVMGGKDEVMRLTREQRRRYVRERHSTMKGLLMHLAQGPHTGVFVSADHLFATRSLSETQAGSAFAKLYTFHSNEESAATSRTAGARSSSPPSTVMQPLDCTTKVEEPHMTEEDFCYPTESLLPSDDETIRAKKSTQFREKVARRVALMKNMSLRPAATNESLLEFYMPIIGPRGSQADPMVLPPPPSSPTPAAAGASTSTFSAEMLAPLVPEFFIPLAALMETLPDGYTVEHVEHLFGQTQAMEVVHLLGEAFVRLHGGQSSQNLRTGNTPESSDTSSLYARYARFVPDPFLCEAFLPMFHRPFVWLSMRALLEQSPAHIRAALGSWQQYHALLFFAQMQHIFRFTPEGDGQLCVATPVTTLHLANSPTPHAVAQVICWLEKKKRVFVSELEVAFETTRDGAFTAHAQRQVLLYFGTLRHLLVAHGSIFRLSALSNATEMAHEKKDSDLSQETGGEEQQDDSKVGLPHNEGQHPAVPSASPIGATGSGFGSGVSRAPSVTTTVPTDKHLHEPYLTVELVWHEALRDKHTSSLEQKLEKALMRNDRRAARKVRRRLALQAYPDSPYADPQLLLDAMLRYLPPRRHVSLRVFLKALPSSLTDFLPENYMQLVRAGVPDRVIVFEYRFRNHLCLQRPHLPLPDGHLRQEFTEDEVIYMVSCELMRQSRAIIDLFSRLPYGVRLNALSMSTNKLFKVLQQFPAHFVLVLRDNLTGDLRNTLVTLLHPPPLPPTLSNRDWDSEGRPPLPEELAEMEEDDRRQLDMGDAP